MYAALVTDLFEAYQELSENNHVLYRGIVSSTDRPLFLPPAFTTTKELDLMLVGKALTRLWHDDTLARTPYSGILCPHQDVLAHADAVNNSKQRFENAIKAVINAEGGDKHRQKEVFRLIEKRDPKLSDAMKTIGISRVNLRYARQRVLVRPAPIESISWTWRNSGRNIRRVTYDSAIKLAESQPSDTIRELALDKLAALPTGTPLARVTEQKSQLNANITWWENAAMQRKSIVTASVILLPNEKLPRIVWRDHPGDDDARPRLERSDVTVDPTPYIDTLGLHLYLR